MSARKIGLFFRLSFGVKPDPVIEIEKLDKICRSCGEGILLITRDASPLERDALVLIGADGTAHGSVLATARSREFIPISSSLGKSLRQQHELYRKEWPDDPSGFLVLSEVRQAPSRTSLSDFILWREDATQLTFDSLPYDREGVSVYFVEGASPPSPNEVIALTRARANELEKKAARLRAGKAALARQKEALEQDQFAARARLVELSKIVEQQAKATARPASGRASVRGRQLGALFSTLAPRIRFQGASTAKMLEADEATLRALGRVLRAIDAKQNLAAAGIYVKDVEGVPGWTECRVGNTAGRVYFANPKNTDDVLVLVSEKELQKQDIAKLTKIDRGG